MKKIFYLFFLSISLSAQDLTLTTNGSLAIFPIQPASRTADIIGMFNTLRSPPYLLSNSQIALQTTKNGLITNVQFITPMDFSTVLVVGYWLPNDLPPPGVVGGRVASVKRYGYVALPIEQIVEMIYSPIVMSSSFTFSSQPMNGTLPIFSVDMAQRAADIIQAVALLSNTPIANNSLYSPVSLSTTLSGPFYGATTSSTQLITNGLIPRVFNVSYTSPNSTLLLVQFKPYRTNTNLANGEVASVVVAPDQINGIIFTQNN